MATAYVNQSPIINQIQTANNVNYACFVCNIASLKSSFAGFIINDTVNLVDVPNFGMLVDYYIDLCSLDSNVSPAVVTSGGDNVSSSHGGAGAGGFFTSWTGGRGASSQLRMGVVAGSAAFVHGTIPWIYSIPNANIPTNNVIPPGPLGAASFMLKFTTAPATATTTGTIYGWVAYQMLAPLENATGTGAATTPQ